MTKFSLRAGGDFSQELLYVSTLSKADIARFYGKDFSFQMLVQEGADVNAEESNSGNTPLHFAAKKRHFENVQELLQLDKIEINKVNKIGQTALMLAVEADEVDIVRELLNAGAYIEAEDFKGNTVLFYAAIKGSIEIFNILLNNFADCEAVNKQGHNIFTIAAENGRRSIVENILEHKLIEVNAANSSGNTALICAVRKGYGDIAELLLNHEADINCVNKNGKMAVDFAKEIQREDLVAMVQKLPDQSTFLSEVSKLLTIPLAKGDCSIS